MSNQAPSLVSPWRKSTRIEHYLVAHRVRMGVHVSCRLLGSRVGKHPHPAEVVPEPRLEEGAGGCIKRLPGRAQYLWHSAGRLASRDLWAGRLFLKSSILVGGGVITAGLSWRGGAGDCRGRHAHYPLRDAVCLMFEPIAEMTDRQLC
jgi:hypothetical protein